jgi:hypothetical protein
MLAMQMQQEYGTESIRLRPENRRVFPRTPARGQAQGNRLDHSLDALRRPCLRLELRDLSLGGVSVISDQPVERGERLSVMFNAMPNHSAWDAYGRVVRCDPSATGWRVAVAFDPLPAA